MIDLKVCKHIRNKEHKLFCESWFLKVKMFWTAEQNFVAGWQTCASFFKIVFWILTSHRVTEMFGLERTLKPSLLQAEQLQLCVFTREVLQLSDNFWGPSLDLLQHVCAECSRAGHSTPGGVSETSRKGTETPSSCAPQGWWKIPSSSHHTSTKSPVHCHRLLDLNIQFICMAKCQRTQKTSRSLLKFCIHAKTECVQRASEWGQHL